MDCKISNKSNLLILLFLSSFFFGLKKSDYIVINGNSTFDDYVIYKLITTDLSLKNEHKIKKQAHLDMLAIKSFYQKNGFLDIVVNFDIASKNNLKTLTYNILENNQYYNGSLHIEGNQYISNKKIASVLNFKNGDLFVPSVYKNNILKLKTLYLDAGKISVKINDFLEKDHNKINVEIKIEEGNTFFINSINYIGLNKIKKKYVTRELGFKKGDLCSNRVINEYQNRLFDLDMFRSVYIETNLIDNRLVNLDIFLDEYIKPNQSYFDMGFGRDIGVGLGSKNYFLGATKTKLRNIFNSSLHFNINFEFNLAFEKLLHDSNISPDIKLDAVFNSNWIFNKKIKSELRFQIYQIKDVENNSLSAYSTDLILLKERKNLSYINKFTIKYANSELSNNKYFIYKLTVNKTAIDNYIYPTDGQISQINYSYNLNIENYSEFYSKIDLSFIRYKKLWGGLIYANRHYFGYIYKKNNIPILPEDNFQLGGANSLRGWKNHSSYLESIGREYGVDISENCILINHELRYKIKPKISVQFFIDAGKLFIGYENRKIDWDYGVGISYFTPLGPIRIDFAKIGGNTSINNDAFINLAFLYAF